MGRSYFRSTEAVWERIAREEWLGCQHVVAHVRHTRINTSVGSMYIIFLIFLKYKNLYVLCFQIYTCIQYNTKTLVVSDLVLARRGSENVFDCPLVLEE